MEGPTQHIYRLMGARPHPECTDRERFVCWVCGFGSVRGMDRLDWMGATFVGQNRVRCTASTVVCEACAVCMGGKPPDTLRMYSHLVEGDTWRQVNKGQKPEIRAFLRREHVTEWLAAVADSGQKHVVPWTPINPPGRGGRVMFEEMLVTLPTSDRGWALIDEMTEMLTRGATKEEMQRGEYGARAWSLCGADDLRTFESERGGERESPWWDLALWLSQRDEARVAVRMDREKDERAAKKAAEKERANGDRRKAKGTSAGSNGGRVARGARVVPGHGGGERAEALGHDSGPTPKRSANKRQRGAVADKRVAEPEAPGTQRSLF